MTPNKTRDNIVKRAKLERDYAEYLADQWQREVQVICKIQDKVNNSKGNPIMEEVGQCNQELLKLSTAIMTGFKMASDGLTAYMEIEQMLYNQLNQEEGE